MATLATPVCTASALSIKNILFATDFSESSMRAFPYAAALAKKFGASILACNVITPSSLVSAAPMAAPYLYEAEYNAAVKELDKIMASPDLRGLKVKTAVSSGILGDAILEQIKLNNIDLIVAGTHGRTGFRRFFLGSAVETICRVAPCPVLTICPESPSVQTEFKHILFPTDLSEESMRVLPLVLRLAEAYKSRVTVLHVLPEELAANPDARQLAAPAYADRMSACEKEFASFNPEFVVKSGQTVETILQIAREKNADLIALGIRGSFLPGFQPHASVVYQVMATSHCPVVTCR
ncbi:MAG TPA: universal stress protein [Candidatus Angelobacter sp.]|nr:universal stress protein [Candidatus Angelobacter sp.]